MSHRVRRQFRQPRAALNSSLAGMTPALTALLSSTSSLNNSFDFDTTGDAFPAPYNANATNFEAVFTGDFTAQSAGTYIVRHRQRRWQHALHRRQRRRQQQQLPGRRHANGHGQLLTAGLHSIVIAYYQGTGGYGFYADVQVFRRHSQRIPNALLGALSTKQRADRLASRETARWALGANQLTVDGPDHDAVFTGIVSGNSAANVVKTGTRSQTIGQPNYGGTTTIRGGTLQLGDGTIPFAAMPSGAISNNGSLIIANPTGSTLSYGGVISGTGSLSISGGGSMTLSGTNTYTGPTNISGGTVSATNNSALGNNDNVTVGANATLNVPATGSVGLAGTYYSSAPNNPDNTQFNSLSNCWRTSPACR